MLHTDPLWYKDVIIYQTHVRAFYDANSDGIGDFAGLTQKLDYLQDLGISAIWLLPFYPSPLKDDGYDTADYTNVHAAYGTLADFKLFLSEAHRRNLRVITELVLNHTSDQHPWFQRARRSPPGSNYRNYYVWSDSPKKYKDARIIFQDFEASNWTWDAIAQSHFWHRFYSHQPDLNYDHPEVRERMFGLLDHWLEMGVDGLRLDAVPYLVEREGTNCENLPETHQYLKELRAHIDAKYPGRMFLAEANQWPEDAVAYFGNGDECHTAFHFPVMPRLFMSIQMEDRFPVIDILEQTPAIPDGCQWVVFLRNHDELTLEMVTDEERDYMYRAYARDPQARVNLGIRRRLAPLVGNDRRKIELLNGLLMSLPGTPVIYYGDEIGMGDNIYLGDRNGVRTPMQWSPDRNSGFSSANPQGLFLPVIIDHEYHYEAINVETQQRNPHSLLSWMRRLIGLRKQHLVFGRGTIEFLYPDNTKVLAFLRKYQDETLLVVANLSRSPQYVQLDLSAFKNHIPVELLGRTEFPPIGALPYLLTLGPYSFYWFSLRQAAERRNKPLHFQPQMSPQCEPPLVATRAESFDELTLSLRRSLESALPAFFECRTWFRNRRQAILGINFLDVLPLAAPSDRRLFLAILQVEYVEGESDLYALPLGIAGPDHARSLAQEASPLVLAWLQPIGAADDQRHVIYDAFGDNEFAAALLDAFAAVPRAGRAATRLEGQSGRLEGQSLPHLSEVRDESEAPLTKSVRDPAAYVSSVVYSDRLFAKWFREIHVGPHPDAEMLTFLAGFAHVPQPAGVLKYRRDRDEYVLATIQDYVRNEGDAWQLALRAVSRFWERVAGENAHREPNDQELPSVDPLALVARKPIASVEDMLAPFDDSLELLGRRTAELHLALAANPDDPAFAPIPISKQYQRSLYQGLRSQTRSLLRDLRQRLDDLPAGVQSLAREVLALEPEIVRQFEPLVAAEFDAARIRCHGDLHLANVLFTGKDFVFIGFEGEIDRPLSERRIKRSPLRDVAQMVDSLRFAAFSAWHAPATDLVLPQGPSHSLHRWAQLWYAWSAASFLGGYFGAAGDSPFAAANGQSRQLLLKAFLLERALLPLMSLPNLAEPWLRSSLEGILQLLPPRTER